MPFLLLVCWLLSGCQALGLGGAATIVTVRSAALGAGELPSLPATACIWIVGQGGGAEQITVVVAHGDVTVAQCMGLRPPGVLSTP